MSSQRKSASSLTVSVENGNRPALRSLLGKSQVQTFATGDKTVFLQLGGGNPDEGRHRRAAVGDYGDRQRPRRSRRLARGRSRRTAAAIVGDRGVDPAKPTKPLYLFRGTFVSGEAAR